VVPGVWPSSAFAASWKPFAWAAERFEPPYVPASPALAPRSESMTDCFHSLVAALFSAALRSRAAWRASLAALLASFLDFLRASAALRASSPAARTTLRSSKAFAPIPSLSRDVGSCLPGAFW
jgi:hypothetical protein